MWWKVVFDKDNAVIIQAPDAFLAKFIGRLQAWSVTGQWLDVLRVEPETEWASAQTEGSATG